MVSEVESFLMANHEKVAVVDYILSKSRYQSLQTAVVAGKAPCN